MGLNKELKNKLWKFSVIPGIEESTFNKVLEKFYDNGISGLVRENVQNSLDGKLHKSYPVVMAPMSEKEDLKEVFLEYLSYYHTEAKVNEDEVKSNKSEGLLSRLFNR